MSVCKGKGTKFNTAIRLAAIFAVMRVFAACGDDSGSASNNDSDSGQTGEAVEPTDSDIIADSFDDLPVCSSKREGSIAYVKDEKIAYICEDDSWKEDREGDSSSCRCEEISEGCDEAVSDSSKTKSSSSKKMTSSSSNTSEDSFSSSIAANATLSSSSGTDFNSSDSHVFSEMEIAIGLCTSSKEAVVEMYEDVYYICRDNAWTEASVLEYETYGLKCTMNGAVVRGAVETANKYVCDADSFRKATDNEVNLGLGCTCYNDGWMLPYSRSGTDTIWVCASSKWIIDVAYNSTMTDLRDNQIYKTLNVGKQIWMAENLNFDYKVNGTTYGTYTNPDKEYAYGRYYTWAAAMDSAGIYSQNSKGCGNGKSCSIETPSRGICPEGWHIPTLDEWRRLFSLRIGDLLVEYYLWPNATDAYGFSVIPAGYYNKGDFTHGGRAYFWIADEYIWRDSYNGFMDFAYSWDVDGIKGDLDYTTAKYLGYSVRCVKD